MSTKKNVIKDLFQKTLRDVQTRGGSRTAATPKMVHFVITVNG